MTEVLVHRPVMAEQVIEALAPRDGALYVDGTFGRGGYAKAMLEAAACQVYGIDRDPEAIEAGLKMAADYSGRLQMLEGRFSVMDALLAAVSVYRVDGVALDLGVSSPQLDDPERGFSFSHDGPLDMRMQRTGRSAADIVNDEPESRIVWILSRYGEERKARRVARAIVAARAERRLARTAELAEVVVKAIGPRGGGRGIHPATRTFQALRIAVNDELGELEQGLAAAERILAPKARLVVVAFHSLEDRLVKRFLHTRAGRTARPSRHQPMPAEAGPSPSFRLLSGRVVKPTAGESAVNPRARSARLRAAERTDAEPWPDEGLAA